MVILQRFANQFVKWSQMATDVQINHGMVSGNPPIDTHPTFTKLYSDILAAREDTTNLGGLEPPMYYPVVCPNGYAKVCVAQGLPVLCSKDSSKNSKKSSPGSGDKNKGKKKPGNENGKANAKMGIFVLVDPNNKDLSSLKNVPKSKDKHGVLRSFCCHGGV
jgi:hypothetical protein